MSTFFSLVRYWKKCGSTRRQYISFVDFKKAYDSVRRAVLYNILIDFGIPMKLIKLIEMCLNETYHKLLIGKHLSYKRPSTYQLQKSATEHSSTCKSHSHTPQQAQYLSVTEESY
jgi:hypothetical protein